MLENKKQEKVPKLVLILGGVLLFIIFLIIGITGEKEAPSPKVEYPIKEEIKTPVTKEEVKQLLTIGESISIGDFSFVVNSVKVMPKWVYEKRVFSYPSGFEEPYYHKVEAREGYKFVVISITIKNNGKEEGRPVPPVYYLKLKTTGGYEYRGISHSEWRYATLEEAEKYYCESTYLLERILPGGSITGCVGFEIPVDLEPLELWGYTHYSSIWEDKPDFIISLK